MEISLVAVIISQCICISKHHIVHIKYIQFYFVSHTSVKLWGKNIYHSVLFNIGIWPSSWNLQSQCCHFWDKGIESQSGT